MPTFAQVSLSTERLLLRPLRASDSGALFATYSDPVVSRYLSRPPWSSLQQAEESIAKDEDAHVNGKYLRLGLERIEDEVLVGDCCLFNLHEQCRRAEIGYGLATHAWGRGYMNEALKALLEFGFSQLALNRVEADIDPRNAASAKSLERVGFKKEGHLRERWIVAGEVSDTAFYGLLRADWELAR